MVTKNLNYGQLIIGSINKLKNNLILFIPDLIFLFVILIISIIALFSIGLLPEIITRQDIFTNKELLTEFLTNFLKTIPLKIPSIVITFITAILAAFVIGSGLEAMKYGMIKDVVNNKKASIKKGYVYGKKYFLNIILLKIFILLLIFVPLIVVGGLTSIFSMILFPISKILAIVIWGLLTFLWAVYVLIISIMLLFRYPLLILEEKRPLDVIKGCYTFFKKNIGFVFICMFIIIAISVLFSFVITAPIQILQNYLLTIFKSLAVVLTITVSFAILKNILILIPSIWSQLFIFLAYLSKKKD